MTIRVGFIGAGYIAQWHAEALAGAGARLTAACDPAPGAAAALASRFGATAYENVDAMLSAGNLDAVHVLTPPHLHCVHAVQALDAGLHVLVEKPFAVSTAEADQMNAAARKTGRVIAVNHNFLALPSYERLQRQLAAGVPGKIDSLDIRWRFPLAPLRSGPFGLWLLRSQANLLLELGPHLFAFAHDLAGPLRDIDLAQSKPIRLPNGVEQHQGWHIRAKAGDVDVTLHLSLVEGAEDRSVEVRGVNAVARLDYGADVLTVLRPNSSDIVINPLRTQWADAWQHFTAGLRNSVRQLGSLNRKSPYALGFAGAMQAFYHAVSTRAAVDTRFSGQSAAAVIDAITRTNALLQPVDRHDLPDPQPAIAAKVLVIGGTGFIGRCLVQALVRAGHRVLVISRGRSNPFADLGDAVEIVSMSLTDSAGLQALMSGMDCVYHLAKAEESSWQAYLENDVAVCERVAKAAIAVGVRRLVYTGTIACYDSSDPKQPITEGRDFGPMENRNLYARSKALCEDRLLALHRDQALPLVIARPGIVVGPGGPLQHWGIGRWHGAGAVKIWGKGHNMLPFVLIDDVAAALVKMADAPGIDGQSFNLVGDPLLSARGYFAAIKRLTGVQIRVASGNLWGFYLGDSVKYALKRFALRQKGLRKPLLIDWKSRAHLSAYRNDHAKAVLDWQPESDADAFARRAISYQGFFGF